MRQRRNGQSGSSAILDTKGFQEKKKPISDKYY